MKKIILLLFAVSIVFTQTSKQSRSITIYKDSFAIVNEPILWNLKAGENVATFTNLSQNLLFDSPKLNIDGVSILSQTLNKNFKSSDSFLKNNIGMPIEVKPNEGSLIQGILMDVNGNSISVKTNKGLTVIHRSQTSFFTLKSSSVQDKFSPELVWELDSEIEKSVEADLTYITSGFLWKPVYTLIVDDSDTTEQFLLMLK